MSKPQSNLSLEDRLTSFEKFYKKDALAKCSRCDDALVIEACSQQCSKLYHVYKQGQRMLWEKYQRCLTQSTNDKAKKDCISKGNIDLDSLQNFVQRVEKEVESIEALKETPQK